jgi:hypothetical protein
MLSFMNINSKEMENTTNIGSGDIENRQEI